ncbi:MAG TPA: STAS domain-containing protein [Blastocatellia bacterium]|nr:STAS domain-containing protein [Blastocatellia bacterium]
MQIKERTVDGVVILDVSGKILIGDGEVQLKRKLTQLLDQGHRQMILNLGEVPYMDSSGLGAIVRCHTAVQRAGGELKLANLTQRMLDLLTITKLMTILDTYDTEEDALKGFGAVQQPN